MKQDIISSILTFAPLGILFVWSSDRIMNGQKDCRLSQYAFQYTFNPPCADWVRLWLSDALFYFAIITFALIFVLPILSYWRRVQFDSSKLNSIK